MARRLLLRFDIRRYKKDCPPLCRNMMRAHMSHWAYDVPFPGKYGEVRSAHV
ncbi:hypothetical protein W02_31590 [Nitrospira sp. KM1]|nr:hypothetical protein W02_31590 [Nitrospira sp. KM1]